MASTSMGFTGSCRPSALHITPTPRGPGRLSAPAVWCLPSRTAWSPRPWARLALMFSTEPSQLTRALQCMICRQLPRASLGSRFAAGLKMPHSCKSVLWTGVLASSPLSTPKARSSPGLCCTSRTFSWLAIWCLHPLTGCARKDARQISGSCRAAAGLDGQSRPRRNVSSCSMLSGFAGPIDQHNCLAKGIQSLTLLDTCYFLAVNWPRTQRS